MTWLRFREEAGGSFALLSGQRAVLQEVEIPDYIPLVTAPLREKCPDEAEWLAVHAGKIRRDVWRGEMGVREQYRLPPGKKIILHWFVEDPYLERFWENRSARMRVLREFDAVFAPNFSVYEDAPRMEHLFNMKRSAVSVVEMAEAGIRVIPDISWYRREDIDRWLEFLDSVGIGIAAFSMQVVGRLKGCSAWQSYLAGLRYFARNFGGRIILVGVNSRKKLFEAFRAAGRSLSLLDTTSFVSARKGKLISSDGKAVRGEEARKVPRDELFAVNATNMKRMVEKLKEDIVLRRGGD